MLKSVLLWLILDILPIMVLTLSSLCFLMLTYASLSGNIGLLIVNPTRSLSLGAYIFLKYFNILSNTMSSQSLESISLGGDLILNVTWLSQYLKRLFTFLAFFIIS